MTHKNDAATSQSFNDKAANENLPQWDLTKIYPAYKSPEFEEDFKKLEDLINAFAEKYENKLAVKDKDGSVNVMCDAATLAQSFEDDREIDDLMGKIYTYLDLKTVQDNEAYGGEEQNFGNRVATLVTKLYFYAHEIKNVPEDVMRSFLDEEESLNRWKPLIEQIRRGIPHTMPLEVEKYQAELGAERDWVKSYDDRLIALRFPFDEDELTLEEILEVFTNDPDSKRRAEAHAIFQKIMNENAWYFTDVKNAQMRMQSVNGRWAKFENPWDSRHFSNGVSADTVDALETAVKDAYSRTSHRFYALKAKLMKQDALNIWDRNINIFESSDDQKVSWTEAKKIVLEAFNSFDPEMAEIAEMFFDNGWIDAAPGDNKASGAFAHPEMASTHNPFVMVNFRGTARDVSTLAHELGHGVHQYWEAQNKAVLHAPLTMAETASVFAEMNTFKLLLERADNDEQRRKMLFEKCNDMVNTNIRQISFYDFEKRIHTHFKETNTPLSSKEMGSHWVGALQDSYGDAIPLDENYGAIFGYISHFYHTPFYVYAYAFGDSLVNALYQVYEEGHMPDAEFKQKYKAMLEAGGTYKPEQLKEDFGLDITDPAFWNKGLDMLEGMINDLEKLCEPLLDQKAKAGLTETGPKAAPEAG